MIEQLVVSGNSQDVFAAGEFGKNVTVWSLKTRSRLSAFDTILDFGGERLAISSENQTIVAAASWNDGIAAYEYLTGRQLWARDDLKNIQRVSDIAITRGIGFGVSTERDGFHLLDRATGETTLKIRGITKLFSSCYGEFCLSVSRKEVQLSNGCGGTQIWRRDLHSFAVLDVAFSDTRVAYAEAAGGIYCCNFFGDAVWTVRLPTGQHVRTLVWNPKLKCWLALGHAYEETGEFQLFEIDNDGTCRSIAQIEAGSDAKFTATGDHLIAASGRVYDAPSGRVIWQFA